MIIAVQGSKDFDSYQIFMRAMYVAMSDIKQDDKEIYLYSAGPGRINNFVAEFSNVTEDSLKARGIKIRFFKVPPSWVEENINVISYFAYLSKPKEQMSRLARFAEDNNVELGWFKF